MIRNFNPPRSGNIDCLQTYHGLQFALIVKTAFFCQESKCLISQKTPYTILQSAFDLKKPLLQVTSDFIRFEQMESKSKSPLKW